MLQVAAPGFQPRLVDAFRIDEEVKVVLERAGGLHGHVVDAISGEPIPSFRVGGQRFLDAGGEFLFEGLRSELRVVIVSAPRYAPRRIGPYEAGAGVRVEAGTIRMDEGGRIRGIVRDANGAPFEGAEVSASDTSDRENTIGWFSIDSTPSDAEGRFELRRVPAGHWNVHARAGPDGFRMTEEIELAEGETVGGIVLSDRAVIRPTDDVEVTPETQILLDVSRRVMESLGSGGVSDLTPSEWYDLIDQELTDDERTPELEEMLGAIREAVETGGG